MNPIFYSGPNPELKGHASPTAERAISSIRENQQRQQNIEQGGFLANTLKGIEGMGDEASLPAILKLIAEGQQGGLNPELAQGLGKQFSDYIPKREAQKNKKKEDVKTAEKVQQLKTGLGTIEAMKKLIPYAGPSNFVSSLGAGNTAKQRSKLAQYGTSLIPLVAAGVPIRNQKEFEEYRKTITNPNSTQASLEGALEGLQGLMTRQLEAYGASENGKGEGAQIPGEPNGFRSQNEKPQGEFVHAKNKAGKTFKIPRSQYVPHPDLTIQEFEETDRSNQ